MEASNALISVKRLAAFLELTRFWICNGALSDVFFLVIFGFLSMQLVTPLLKLIYKLLNLVILLITFLWLRRGAPLYV